MLGREVVIAEAVRTPVGRGHAEKGWFKDVHPPALLGATFSEVVERAGIPAAAVEDVVAGCVSQYGVQSYNVARNAWLHEGLPVETGTTVDRQCGSAQQAINFAAALVGTGAHDVVIGGGVEHMGRVPLSAAGAIMEDYGQPFTPELLERHPVVHQGLIAERWEISRGECDEIALRSQQRAARATDEGRFEREILPFGGNGTPYTSDQGIRPTTLEAADELGVRPRARTVDHLTVGVDPVLMLTGPIPATRKVLERNGMAIGDVDLIEINEAFASVIAAWERELALDTDKVNVNGGAIALGHPLGATGARLMATLLHELERSDGQFGLVTMCCGGGLGTATLIERI